MIGNYKKLHALLDFRERRNFLVVIGIMLVEALLEMIGIGIIPVFVTIIAFPDKLTEYSFYNSLHSIGSNHWLSGENLIYAGSALLLLFFISKFMFTMASTYVKARFAQNRSLKLSQRLFSSYLEAPYSFHFRRGSAELIRNISSECTLLSERVLVPMIDIVSQTMIMIGILVILLLSVPFHVLVWLMVFLGAGVGGATMLNKHVRLLGEESQTSRKDVLQLVKEGIDGAKEIKILQRTAYFKKKFWSLFFRLLQIERTIKVIQEALPNIIELITIVGLLGVTAILFSSGRGAETIIPILSVFAVALVRMKGSMRMIMYDLTSINHYSVSLDLVYNELSTLRNDSPDVNQNDRSEEQILPLPFDNVFAIKDVWYKYPETSKYALQSISLQIPKGEMIGFVGSSGAGKSTLIDIFIGVLKPDKGQLLVDKLNILDQLPAWQKNIGYIPQTIFLVDGTIKQNIALGIEYKEINEDAITRAVCASNMVKMIEDFPDGVDTLIGDHGIKLSGGERQRIAIARAMYNNPDVLVLDEATSALDNVTEAGVIQEVEALKGDRTILIIAHRLSTVQRCDRIVFLKDGKVDEIGTYEELASSHPDFIGMLNAGDS